MLLLLYAVLCYKLMYVCVPGVKKQLEDIKSQISKVTSDIPVSTLNNLAEELGQAMKYVGQYKPETERAEHIR